MAETVVTKFDLAIWLRKDDSVTYALPLGAEDVCGDLMYPELNTVTWEYKGTLPKGQVVTGVKPVVGKRVSCKIAGAIVHTAAWAIQ